MTNVEAFDREAGDKLSRKPEDRVRIWYRTGSVSPLRAKRATAEQRDLFQGATLSNFTRALARSSSLSPTGVQASLILSPAMKSAEVLPVVAMSSM